MNDDNERRERKSRAVGREVAEERERERKGEEEERK